MADETAARVAAIRAKWIDPIRHADGVYRRPSVVESQRDVQDLLAALAAAEQRAARLAALEQAARALKAETLCVRLENPAEHYERAVGAVFDALIALDAPPDSPAA